MKRALALILSVLMLASLLPTAAFADDVTDGVQEVETTEPEVAEELVQEEPSAEEETPAEEIVQQEVVENIEETSEETFDVEAAYAYYMSLETEEAKVEYLNSLSEENRATLLAYIAEMESFEEEPVEETEEELLDGSGVSEKTETSVASVTIAGETEYYDDFATVVTDVNAATDTGEITVTLLNTVTLSAEAKITNTTASKIIIDLNNQTISGNNACRVFNIGSGVKADIKNGTITAGAAANGAGIYVSGATVLLDSLTVSSCKGTGTSSTTTNGAGVYVTGSAASVTIQNTTITGCSAVKGKASYAYGGGLGVAGGTVSIISGSIVDCTGASGGGAINVTASGTLIITDLTANKTLRNLGSFTINGGKYDCTYSTSSSSVAIVVNGGWFTSQVGASTLSAAGTGKYATGECADAPDTTYAYTVADAEKYKLSFSVPTHGTAVADVETAHGTKATLPGVTVDDGYQFDGWYLNDAYTGTSYSKDDTVEFSTDKTLYAKVSAIPSTYKITFDANGKTGITLPEEQTLNSGESYTLTDGDILTETNFINWNTAADGSGTAYTKDDDITPTENVTLYAQWAVAKIGDVKYTTLAAALDAATEGQTVTITDNCELSAYQWKDKGVNVTVTDDGNGPYTVTLTGTSYGLYCYNGKTACSGVTKELKVVGTAAGAITLKAADGATFTTAMISMGQYSTVTMENTVVDGNGNKTAFDGASSGSCYLNLKNVEIKNFNGASGVALNLKCKAVELENIKITNCTAAISADATLSSGATVNITGDNTEINGAITKSDTSKTTITISAGKFDNDPSAYVDSSTYQVTLNEGIYTVEPKSKVAISYDANGSELEVPSTTEVDVDSEYTVLGVENAPEDFFGWNTAADGTGTAYKVGETFTVTEGLTLYAQFEVAKIGDVSYSSLKNAFNNANDGDIITVTYDVALTDRIELTALAEDTAKSFTLDLNGKTITYTGTGNGFLLVRAYNTVTITGNGTVDIQNKDYYLSINENGTVNIQNGTFKGEEIVFGTKGKLSISGGSFSKDVLDYCAASHISKLNTETSMYDVTELTEEETAVVIDGVKYASIAAAISAAPSGSTLVIKNDVEIESVITVAADKVLTLDLNGKTVTAKEGITDRLFTVKGTLTVKDDSEDKTGKMVGSANYDGSNGSIIYVSGDTAVVNIESGVIEEKAGKSGLFAYNGTLNISGGTIYGKISRNETNGTVVITGGLFDTEFTKSYAADGYGEVSVTTDGVTWWQVTNQKATIYYNANGGIEETLPEDLEVWYIPGVQIDQEYNMRTQRPIHASMLFYGWNTMADGSGVSYESGAKISVTEDTTLYAIWEPAPIENVAKVIDGVEDKEYKSLANAIYYAKSGDTIQLLADATENISIQDNEAEDITYVIDLAGHVITSASSGSTFTIYGETVNIIDSVGYGKITGTLAQTSGGAFDVRGGQLTLSGVSVYGESPKYGGAIYINGGKVIVASGTVVSGTSGQGGAAYLANNANSVLYVYGGTKIGGDIYKTSSSAATIALYGGLYTVRPNDDYVDSNFVIKDNADTDTNKTYKYKVALESPVAIDIKEKNTVEGTTVLSDLADTYDLYDLKDNSYKMSLGVETISAMENVDVTDEVKWTSSNKKLAEIDENGVITFHGVGTVKITAKLVDNPKVTATATIIAYYLDRGTSIKVVPSTPKAGLQIGSKAYLNTYGYDKTMSLLSDSDILDNLVIESLDPETVKVNEDEPYFKFSLSALKANAKGTKVNVTLTGCSELNVKDRKATVTVKTIEKQVNSIETSVVSGEAFFDNTAFEDKGFYKLSDASTISPSGSMLAYLTDDVSESADVVAVKLTASCDGTEVTDAKFKWTTSDAKVATVAADKADTKIAYITVKKGASGQCTVTATCTDAGASTTSIVVEAADLKLRLGSSTATLNTFKTADTASVNYFESYTTLINGDASRIDGVEFVYTDTKTKTEQSMFSAAFVADTEDPTKGVITVSGAGDVVANKAYKGVLRISPVSGEAYDMPFTVTVKNAVPTIKSVKQTVKYNTTTLKYGEVAVATSEQASSVTLSDDMLYKLGECTEIIDAKGVYTYTSKIVPADGDTTGKTLKGTITVNFDGYKDDYGKVSKAFTVGVEKTVLTGKLASSALTINGAYPQASASTKFVATNMKDGDLYKEETQQIYTCKTAEGEDVYGIDVTFDENGNITAVANDNFAAPAKKQSIKVTFTPAVDTEEGEPEIKVAKPITVTVNVLPASTAAKVSVKASGKIDLLLRGNKSYISYKFTTTNIGNLENVKVYMFDSDSEKFQASNYIAASNEIRLCAKEGANLSTSKTYTVYLVPVISEADGITLPAIKQTFKVTQSSIKLASPAAKQTVYQSSSKAEVTYTINLTAPAGAEFIRENITADCSAISNALSAGGCEISVNETTATLKLTLGDTTKLVAGKTYTIPVNVIAANAQTGTKATTIKLSLNVQK